jgi:hypothetical protein
MITSITLSILSSGSGSQRGQSIIDQVPATQTAPAEPSSAPTVPVQ